MAISISKNKIYEREREREDERERERESLIPEAETPNVWQSQSLSSKKDPRGNIRLGKLPDLATLALSFHAGLCLAPSEDFNPQDCLVKYSRDD